MIYRSYDISNVKYLREEFPCVDTRKWISLQDNIALTNGIDYAMFEKGSDGIYNGHYFFEVRGKEAVRVAKEMLEFAFTKVGIKAIRGLTPLSNLKARWMSRRLGFKGNGVVNTDAGPCELFILTQFEWKGQHE